ncbi:MAG: long-chain-fatty-acid--CoA ligase [Rhodospirillaceae bacterium]|nr:long-chain-fatty-acid--CoA ligase [Rhodospirillaceae bacterium]MBT7957631.1 long-chain-fatty-acid--CoA ligase [Rhodospirillaceae bacterium]
MLGKMMDMPLTITSLIQHAANFHGDTEIVSRSIEGPIHRYTYSDAYQRVQKMANAFIELGVKPGDRIATLAWNGYRHLELYFATSGIGAVCHTINPRLFGDQIAYIINHAQDKIIFVDLSFVPVLEGIKDKIDSSAKIVVMTDQEHLPDCELDDVLCYEDLLAGRSDHYNWPDLNENTACSLCYSSGTTGNPKGVLFSHRSTVLHAWAAVAKDTLGISAQDAVLPVVPMFHVNAWGIPYASAMAGAKLVFPGAGMDGASVYELLDQEEVSFTAGVPTVWLLLLQYLQESGNKLPHLERMVVGGAALPPSIIEAFENDYGCDCVHAWGMTEMSPLGTVGYLKRNMKDLSAEEKMSYKVKQGRAVYGVEMKIVDDDGNELPHNGQDFGELVVRGPWITNGYFEDDEATAECINDDGWLRTGDVCTIDERGFMQIVDRSKDVIKSGGEWISSIELENIAVGHADIAEAAVIGLSHPKWDERPLLICVKAEGAVATGDNVLKFFKGKVADFWIPNEIAFVDELPHTATGKLLKTELRKQFADHTFAD